MFNFLPHTPEDRLAMLADLGLPNDEALFDDIPASIRQQAKSAVYKSFPQKGLSEPELLESVKALARKNQAPQLASFLGGGAYHRFIPSAVNTIAGRSEFYTAYTPYQPEMSQGTLQVGFEFQTMIAELAGMDVANASVYDGATALAEAGMMALRIKKVNRLIVARSVNPQYRQVIDTYMQGFGGITVETIDLTSSLDGLTAALATPTAAVLVQSPNYFGGIEDLAAIATACQSAKALFVVSADPIALGALKRPGQYGADIVVGDIQPLGNALAFGGPYGGFMATKTAYMRQLPGRLVGKTTDKTGRPCYTLTLQTREQHIRRAKATSNICTNQALNVLKATVYMALVGPVGLRELATVSGERAHWLAEQLTALPGVTLAQPNTPFLSEFAVIFPKPVTGPEGLLDTLKRADILGGIPLAADYPEYANSLLISVTEMTTPEHLQRYVDTVTAWLNGQAPATHNGRCQVANTPALSACSV